MATITITVVAYQLPLGDCNVFRQEPSGDVDGDVTNVAQQPGCVIGMEHGTYTSMNIKALQGNVTLPIKVIPLADTGRLVEYQAGSGDANIRNNQHVHWDGSGVPGEEYGFKFYSRMHWYDNEPSAEETLDIEVNNVDIDIDAPTDTIALKVTPRIAHIIDGISIHDNMVRTVFSTAMYIGNPRWTLHIGDEEINNVEIYDNYVYGSESGIELKGCPIGGEIHHNIVVDTDPSTSVDNEGAIYFDQGTQGEIHGNIVIHSEGNGIAHSGRVAEIYNNLVIECGGLDPTYDDCIRVHAIVAAYSTKIYNNTIATTTDNGIDVSGSASNVEAYNNIIVNCVTGSIDQGGSPGGNFHDNLVQESGYTLANFDFVDYLNDDYHIEVTSPAVGAGTNVGAPAADLDGVARGNPPDTGCYEYVP